MMAKRERMWEIKQSADEDKLDIYIYGDVDTAGLFSSGKNSAETFRKQLSEKNDVKQIDIYINSNGGSVMEGTAIYNQLKRHTARKIVHIDGFACSVASVIAMAGDEVHMPPNTMMMIHNMWMYTCGSAAELRKDADDLDKINDAGRVAYLNKSGGKLDERKLVEMMDAETWLTAEECLAYGLADIIDEDEVDTTEAEALIEASRKTLQQRISFTRALSAQLRELSRGESNPGADSEFLPISELSPEPETLNMFERIKANKKIKEV